MGRWPRFAAVLSVVAAVAGSYRNALGCGFAFDDAFAITYNGDVTDPQKPLKALLEHDFWGQDIRGEGSHKSYRQADEALRQLRRSANLRSVTGRLPCSRSAQTGLLAPRNGGRGRST